MQGRWVELDTDQLGELYLNKKWSFAACASHFGCSSTVIKNRLKQLGIKPRRNTEWAIGYKFSEEHMRKFREGRRAAGISEEERAATSRRFKGKKLSEEHKKKIALAHTGRPQPWMKQNGADNPNWHGGHSASWFSDPIINRCYLAIRTARRQGRIKVKPCEVCGSCMADAHHDDYRKPFKIRWLCRSHHAAFHQKHVMNDYRYVSCKEGNLAVG